MTGLLGFSEPSLLNGLAWVSLSCAALPAALFSWNLFYYRPPRPVSSEGSRAMLLPVSVLIPVRDEDRSIAASVESVLASVGVELEVIVLDDGSTDRTAAIVRAITARDRRVRLESAPPLPTGWNGKQHACSVLASLAQHDVLCFLDADVRVAPDAIGRMVAFLDSSWSELVSGFPRQETVTWMEWLLLPLIHFVLLEFLPLGLMRRSVSPAFAAGCGQFMVVCRYSYEAIGGHAAIRTTMHDGIKLPALFRAHGYRTDLADLTELATCRMYRSAGEVWRGLAKNATEGLAAPSRIVLFTVLLLCGQVLPLALLGIAVVGHYHRAAWIAALALSASLLPRALGLRRFHQRLRGALLHPVGVLLLLVLQWYALIQKLRGKQARWKQRAYDPG